MVKLKYAQDLIKTRNGRIAGGFNSFINGSGRPDLTEYDERQGYEFAREMAEDDGIAFTCIFKCKCGKLPYYYGGFFNCECGRRHIKEDWWKIKVEKDGNAFCCHSLDFEPHHIIEDGYYNYAFGETFDDAINKYEEVRLKATYTKA